MADLSVSTYKKSSPACCLLAVRFCVVSPRLIYDIWGFSPLGSDFVWLKPPASPPQPGHIFAATLTPDPLPPLFRLLRLISKSPMEDP